MTGDFSRLMPQLAWVRMVSTAHGFACFACFTKTLLAAYTAQKWRTTSGLYRYLVSEKAIHRHKSWFLCKPVTLLLGNNVQSHITDGALICHIIFVHLYWLKSLTINFVTFQYIKINIIVATNLQKEENFSLFSFTTFKHDSYNRP